MSDRETKRMRFTGEEPLVFMDVGMLHPGDVVDFPLPLPDPSVDEQTEFSHPLLEETSDELHRATAVALAAEEEEYTSKKLFHNISHGVIKTDDGVPPVTPELQAIIDAENAAVAAGDDEAAQRAAALAHGNAPPDTTSAQTPDDTQTSDDTPPTEGSD